MIMCANEDHLALEVLKGKLTELMHAVDQNDYVVR